MYTPTEDLTFLPPHTPTPVTGLHAYSHCLSLRPGDVMDLRATGDGPVEIDIVRYGRSRDDALPVAELGTISLTPQPIHRGDYLRVASPPDLPDAFSVELWCRLLDHREPSALLACSRVRLMLAVDGCLSVDLPAAAGGWQTLKGPGLFLNTWHHVAAVVTPESATLVVDGVSVARLSGPAHATADDRAAPLLLGAACDADGRAHRFFTGDLYAPALYGRALASAELAQRCIEKSDQPAAGCLACWAFDAQGGAPYRDRTGSGHDARPVNYPTRMIAGPRIRTNADWRYYDPALDPDFGGAVRLFRDTLVDCRWPVVATWRVPQDQPSGHYAARLRDAQGVVRHIPVVVRSPAPRARLLCISTTNTRIAYNFESFRDGDLDQGAYKHHAACPLLATMNGVRRPAGGDWFAHTLNFELPFYDWLDHEGIAYDLITEWDLVDHPEQAEAYAAIAIAGHSEYWTGDFHDSLRRHVDRGGHLLLMTGNTGFWRATEDRVNQVVEIRKHERKTVVATDCGPLVDRAYCHQMDGRPGSYLHWSGYAVHNLTGGFTNGFTDPPINGLRAGYRVRAPDHPLFQQPHVIDTRGLIADGAAGYETDIAMRSVLERFGNPLRGYYPHRDGTLPPRLETSFDAGLVVLAHAELPGPHYTFGYDVHLVRAGMAAEMLWREFPSGGCVFHAGSVLAAWPLRDDPNYSRFLLNVLHRLGVDAGPPAQAG